MAFLKSIKGGKKSTPMPGPKSAAYKKLAAAKKGEKSAADKKKKSRVSLATMKAKQALVERIKRQIWSSFQAINDAIILLAKAGNTVAAKTLFDFAGVYALPAPNEENVKAAPVPIFAAAPSAAVGLFAVPAQESEPDPVEGLSRSMGVAPPGAECEPELVAVG